MTEEGVTIPTNQIPPLPVIIRPGPHILTVKDISAAFEGGVIALMGRRLAQETVSPGGWLRFSLLWACYYSRQLC